MRDPELDELKREFLAEALEKVQEIETSLDGDETRRDRVAYLAHQLKGSGGSYGYQRISSVAAELEKMAEQAGDPTAMKGHAASLRSEIVAGERELATSG